MSEEPKQEKHAGCGGTGIAIVALLVSLVSFFQFWVARLDPRLSAEPGGWYATFIGPDNDPVGHISDDYDNGFILKRIDPKRARRIEMLVGDEGVKIVLYRDETPVARWSLTDDGEKFEKLRP